MNIGFLSRLDEFSELVRGHQHTRASTKYDRDHTQEGRGCYMQMFEHVSELHEYVTVLCEQLSVFKNNRLVLLLITA